MIIIFPVKLSNRPQVSMVYLQVNTLSEWIIGIYLHKFTNKKRNFEFIVSGRVQVNPDNSLPVAMSALTFLSNWIPANKNRQTLSQQKPWCNYSGVLNLHHGYYTTIMTSRRFHHNPVSHGTNQPIRKSKLVQCVKVE